MCDLMEAAELALVAAEQIELPPAAAPIAILKHLWIVDQHERQYLIVAGAHGLLVNLAVCGLPTIKSGVGADLPRHDVIGALRITPSWRRFAGLDRRARLAHERDGPFEGAFSFAQSLISPRFSTS
jgi:hypothetical protein